MEENIKQFTIISTFAGCGGSSLGYQWAGFRELLAIDFDLYAIETFKINFPEIPVWQRDIKTVTAKEILDFCKIERGQLDVLDGSPPCQGFSTAGKRAVTDRRNDLFVEFKRLVDGLLPKILIMENVSGVYKGKMRGRFIEIIMALKSLEYQVKCKLMNTMWYGVPQSRERLIWIGIRKDLGIEPSFPIHTVDCPISVTEAIGASKITSGWRGEIKNALHQNKWRSANLPSPTITATQPPIVLLERHPGYRNAYFSDGPSPTITGRKPKIIYERHEPHIIEAWEAGRPGQSLRKARKYVGSHQSIRLDPDKPSPTQIASHRHWRWDEPRYLSIEEAKVLQSFPLDFKVSKYQLIGNSVPPKFMQAIAEHVRKEILEKING